MARCQTVLNQKWGHIGHHHAAVCPVV